jgi:hypothetical protein
MTLFKNSYRCLCSQLGCKLQSIYWQENSMSKLSQKGSIYFTSSILFSHNSYSLEDNLVNEAKTPYKYLYSMVHFPTGEYCLDKFQAWHYICDTRLLSLCWDIVKNHYDKAVSMNGIDDPFIECGHNLPVISCPLWTRHIFCRHLYFVVSSYWKHMIYRGNIYILIMQVM